MGVHLQPSFRYIRRTGIRLPAPVVVPRAVVRRTGPPLPTSHVVCQNESSLSRLRAVGGGRGALKAVDGPRFGWFRADGLVRRATCPVYDEALSAISSRGRLHAAKKHQILLIMMIDSYCKDWEAMSKRSTIVRAEGRVLPVRVRVFYCFSEDCTSPSATRSSTRSNGVVVS